MRIYIYFILFVLLMFLIQIKTNTRNIIEQFWKIVFSVRLLFFYEHPSFMTNNFNKLFPNIDNINSNYFYSPILNISKHLKNNYIIVNNSQNLNCVENIIINKNKHQNLKHLVTSLLPYVNNYGRNININDCVIVDYIKSDIQGFPTFHTDIEWNFFNNSDGFQIWYLF